MPIDDRCMFCVRPAPEHVDVPSRGARACRRCTKQLGSLLLAEDLRVAAIWPALRHLLEDDEEEPEVRLPDGRVIQLKQRTAELKEQLPMEKRAILAGTYVEIGMFREAVLEAALVLVHGARPEALTTALEVLLRPPLGSASAVEDVRALLQPN